MESSEPLVVVTGASSGIGLATATAFAAAGNPVLAIAREESPGSPPAEGIEYAAADVAHYPALERAIRDAEAAHGTTECLVNSAGLLDARAFAETDPERYRREIETNLIGTMNAAHVVLEGMLAAGSGTIVNISSVSDRRPAPAALAYTASKFGVRAFSESLRLAYGMQGLRVVNVAPGYVRTRIHEQMGISFEEYRERIGNPDFISADQLAEAILWCYRLPAEVTVRDLEIAPTRATF